MFMLTSAILFTQILLLTQAATLPGRMDCEPSRVPYKLPHPQDCDRYFLCQNRTLSERLCDDGMVFSVSDEMCDMPQRVDCTGRPGLQPPKGMGNCPRLNGVFHHPQFCDQYYYCREGKEILITCPVGLIYDLKGGVCEFPDVALRPGCMPEEVLHFTCPPLPKNETLAPADDLRFPKADDCRYFFKCQKNGYPRLGGCEMGRVFNRETRFCDDPKNVKGCEKYYKDIAAPL